MPCFRKKSKLKSPRSANWSHASRLAEAQSQPSTVFLLIIMEVRQILSFFCRISLRRNLKPLLSPLIVASFCSLIGVNLMELMERRRSNAVLFVSGKRQFCYSLGWFHELSRAFLRFPSSFSRPSSTMNLSLLSYDRLEPSRFPYSSRPPIRSPF